MWKRFTLAVGLAALTWIGPVWARAQGAASGASVIAEVHASGSQRYGDTQIAAAAGMKPGDSVTREQIQAAADRMALTGLFRRVNYQFTSKGNKIDLTFELTDAPAVPVYFDNFPWFTDEELTAAIRAAAPIFDGSAPTDGTLLTDMTDTLNKMLASKGISGSVEHTLIAQPAGNAMMMQFHVQGPELTIASMDFGDSLAQTSEKLRDRKGDLVGKPYSRYSIDVFENEQVRPIYLSAGYVRAQFHPPQVSVPAGGSQGAMQIPVTLQIDPGPVFTLGGFRWIGAKVFEDKSLATLVGVQPGELADGMRLTAGWLRIEDEYAARGFLDVKVTPEPTYDDDAKTVSYQVTINEGPQYRMGQMVITGLSLDAEKRLRAAWQIPPGRVFDRTAFDALLAKIEKPSPDVFSDIPVHYEHMGHWLQADAEKHTVDVLLDFQ